MLKWSDDEEKKKFSTRVINFINPKYDNPNEMELAEVELYSFASKCELTADEFLLALEMAADGKLFSEDEKGISSKVKIYREIDRLKLGEVKDAYINLKRKDEKYSAAKQKISQLLNPPPELTEDEQKEVFINFLRTEYKRLEKGDGILGTTEFYKLIIKSGMEKVNLKFVEQVLDMYKPETNKSGLSISRVGTELDSPSIVKNNVKTFFINALVNGYIKQMKIHDLSEEKWVDHWLKI